MKDQETEDLKKEISELKKIVEHDVNSREGAIAFVGLVFFCLCIYSGLAKLFGWPLPW